MPNETNENTQTPKTFRQRLKEFWYDILAMFGLCTIRAHNNSCTIIRDSYEVQLEAYKEKLRITTETFHEKFDAMQRDLDRIKELDATDKEQYREAVAQLERYRDAVPAENVDMIKTLQKQIGEIYATSRNFGFPNSLPMPGSISMSDNLMRTDDGEFYDAKVRMILMDDETQRINNEPDQRKRYIMMVDLLRRRGMLERIGERMITGGAATLAIAYNQNNTNYELYAEFTAKILPDAGTIRTDDSANTQ